MFLSIRRYKGKAVVVLLVFCLFIFFLSRGVRNYNERIISMELISLNYPGKISFGQEEYLRAIQVQLEGAKMVRGQEINCTHKLVLISRMGSKAFVFHDPGRLSDLRTGNIYLLRDGGRCLEPGLKQLESMNPYGEFLTWDQVEDIFRKFDNARVIDFETGMSFLVQRRAGRNHADVQPLTAEDSAVMKTIYGGKWSWRRRAIIVEIGGHRLAASMNGMPHGAGAIPNNDFAGHFCIHFRDSKTHANEDNLAHQIMGWKAAGKVMEKLVGAKPEKVTRVMLVAMEQADPGLAAKMFVPSTDWPEAKIAQELAKIKWLVVSKISQPKIEGTSGQLNLIVSYGLADGTRVKNRRVTFILKKDPKAALWRIDPSSLKRLLSKQTTGDETVDDLAGIVYSDWYVDNSL
jgi:hypothetical protein